MKSRILIFSALAMGVLLYFSSCTKGDILGSTSFSEDFTISTGSDSSCLTLVFPVSIVYPDGTTEDFANQTDLDAARTEWKASGLYSKSSHPELVFPVSIVLADGTEVSVADEDTFHDYVHACKGEGGHHRGDHHDGDYDGHHVGPWGGLLSGKCVVVSYPISISYPDGTTESYADSASVREAVAAWLTDNQDSLSSTYRPSLVYPISVTLVSDGSTVEIVDDSALHDVLHACHDSEHSGGKHGLWGVLLDGNCLTANFPLAISYPDGSTVSYDDAETLVTDLEAWHEANEDSIEEDNRPTLVFPISVTLADGTTQEVADEEALKSLLSTCKREGKSKKGGKRGGGKRGH